MIELDKLQSLDYYHPKKKSEDQLDGLPDEQILYGNKPLTQGTKTLFRKVPIRCFFFQDGRKYLKITEWEGRQMNLEAFCTQSFHSTDKVILGKMLTCE